MNERALEIKPGSKVTVNLGPSYHILNLPSRIIREVGHDEYLGLLNNHSGNETAHLKRKYRSGTVLSVSERGVEIDFGAAIMHVPSYLIVE